MITTAVVVAFAAVGSVTVLAAIGLYGLAWREAGICRHIEAQTQPAPPEWVNDGRIDILAAFERDIRTDGRLEQAMTEELGL